MPVSSIPPLHFFPCVPALASLDDRLESARDLISFGSIPQRSLRDCVIIKNKEGRTEEKEY